MIRTIDVDPDFGAGRAGEAVHVHIARTVDVPLDFESQTQVLVGGILNSVSAVRICCPKILLSKSTQKFRFGCSRVRAGGWCTRRFIFVIDLDVAIVCVLRNPNASPVPGGTGAGTVGIRIFQRQSIQAEAGSEAVIAEGRQHNREEWLTDDLQRAANPVVDIQWFPSGREARECTLKFDYQARVRIAVEPNSPVCVEVRNHDLIQHHMHNICVVPDALSCEHFATNDHAIDGVSSEKVVRDERSLIEFKSAELVKKSGGSPIIIHISCRQGIDVDCQNRATIVPEYIVQNDGLSPTRKNRARRISCAAKAARRCGTTGAVTVLFEDRVRDTQLGLVCFNCIEASKITVGRDHAASKCHQRLVETPGRCRGKINAAPQADIILAARAGFC